MQPSRLIDRDVTPSGEVIELVFEASHYLVRVAGAPLMSSAMYGSEQEMAKVAAQRLTRKGARGPRILVGGLGMGFTLRAALDLFGNDAELTVAELLPAVIRFNQGELGELTARPLDDPRVTLFEGDVHYAMARGAWDAVLMDVDNGPDAFTVPSNSKLYNAAGIKKLMGSLSPGGVAIVWSAFASPEFERLVKRQGFAIESLRVRGRGSGKGPRHTLFVLGPWP